MGRSKLARKSKSKAQRSLLKKSLKRQKRLREQQRKALIEMTIPRGQPLSQTILDKSSIFCYFGHGMDICVDRTLDLKVVPFGSAYINTVQCGRIAQSFGQLEYIMSLTDVQRLLRKERKTRFPIEDQTSNILRPYNDLLTGQARIRNLSVHLEGETQVNNYFQPYDDATQQEYRKGTWDYDGQELLIVRKAGLYTFALVNDSAFEYTKTVYGSSILDAITWQFEGVLQPSQAIVRNFLLNNQTFPGAPTSDLNTILEKNFQLEYLSDWQQFLGRVFRRPVSELLNDFPGIHLNVLCRTVDPECEAAALERRTMSPL